MGTRARIRKRREALALQREEKEYEMLEFQQAQAQIQALDSTKELQKLGLMQELGMAGPREEREAQVHQMRLREADRAEENVKLQRELHELDKSSRRLDNAQKRLGLAHAPTTEEVQKLREYQLANAELEHKGLARAEEIGEMFDFGDRHNRSRVLDYQESQLQDELYRPRAVFKNRLRSLGYPTEGPIDPDWIGPNGMYLGGLATPTANDPKAQALRRIKDQAQRLAR